MSSSPLTVEVLLRFIAEIPLTDDTDLWLDQFKTSLCELLPDVDRVSIVINYDYDLTDLERDQIAMIQRIEGGPMEALYSQPPDSPMEAFEYFKRQGHPVEQFQIPVTLNFMVKGRDRLATVYLWRKVGLPAISRQTILIVLSLHALIALLLINVIRGRLLRYPAARAFVGSLVRLAEETGITQKQNRILLHLLEVDSYDEIARKTGVSTAAVKDTVRRLYRRAGVKSLRELYFKYFVPHFDRKSDF